MVKTYPCPYSVTALTLTMGAGQAIVFALCTERHWSDWKLGWNIRLLTVAYTVCTLRLSLPTHLSTSHITCYLPVLFRDLSPHVSCETICCPLDDG